MEKKKGSDFERQIARFLTKWLTGQDKEYYFYRSPSSGALATITETKDVSGDIIALKPEAKVITDIFSFELKNGYPDADIMKHFKSSKNNTIEDFWKQCITDARTSNKWAMLIFKKKNYKPIVGVEHPVVSYINNYICMKKSVRLTFDDLPCVIFYDFDDFFTNINVDILRNMPPYKI